MSKSELKRQCTQKPLDAAERIAELETEAVGMQCKYDLMKNAAEINALKVDELERRVKVLIDSMREADTWIDSDCKEASEILRNVIEQTPQQTAEQIERGHIEWMMKLPVVVCTVKEADGESVVYAAAVARCKMYPEESVIDWLVAIPKLPEAKE